jgi:hypothetical protein
MSLVLLDTSNLVLQRVNEEQGENFDSSKKKVVTILDIVETYILFIKRMIVSILLIMQRKYGSRCS